MAYKYTVIKLRIQSELNREETFFLQREMCAILSFHCWNFVGGRVYRIWEYWAENTFNVIIDRFIWRYCPRSSPLTAVHSWIELICCCCFFFAHRAILLCRYIIMNTTDLAKTYAYLMPEGAGIAQWLERRTRDWKVAGSNPCWNGGRIFFSRVDYLCWLLFRYPFHPRVTTVARKKSRSFCQRCRWQVTAKHAYTLRMWILLNRASALVTTCP